MRTAEHNAKISAGLKARGGGTSPTKSCPGCKAIKPRSEFGVRENGYSKSLCRSCEAERAAVRWATDPLLRERSRATNRATKLRLTYGMTVEQYDSMVLDQGGVCAICAEAPPEGKQLVVDHDHGTGTVRALLCSPCNSAIGMLRDDPDRARAAAEYLERFALAVAA